VYYGCFTSKQSEEIKRLAVLRVGCRCSPVERSPRHRAWLSWTLFHRQYTPIYVGEQRKRGERAYTSELSVGIGSEIPDQLTGNTTAVTAGRKA
jgi:hypothetical protein